MNEIPPEYDVNIVETAILEFLAEVHPEHLPTKAALVEEVVSNPEDQREIETLAWAVSNLREFGLINGEGLVRLTPASVHAIRLLT